MKKEVKKNVLNAVAKISLGTAKKACDSASWWDCHQPKEPEALKQMKSKASRVSNEMGY